MKFNISISLMDNDTIKVEAQNPGDINPLAILGLLEKVKIEFAYALSEDKNDS